MNPAPDMQPGAVVQVDIDHDPACFAACFVLVTEVRSWGVQGFVFMPASKESLPGRAYLRLKWEDVEPVGPACWVPLDDAT